MQISLLKLFAAYIKKGTGGLRRSFFICSGMACNKPCGAVQPQPIAAVCQITSKTNKEENFTECQKLIQRAVFRGAKMVFLPEGFDFIAENHNQAIELAESLSGPVICMYRELAEHYGVWLSLGGFHEKGPVGEDCRIFNSHIIINCDGDIVAVYRKTHLFDVKLPTGQKLSESQFVIPGEAVIPPVVTPIGKLGLAICYDVRFPELSLGLRSLGTEILTYPSAFTIPTGIAHWEVLLRNRAIENQCFVIAAAQTGHHNPKRSSFGHAMIIDPWGAVIAQCREGTDVALAEIDISYLNKLRTDSPVWNHRRPDLYGSIKIPHKKQSDKCTTTSEKEPCFISEPANSDGLKDSDCYQFGQVKLKGSQLFYKTKLSMAFVNKKPVLPGHVLVAPLRIVEKVLDLKPEEIADIFQTVQKVQEILMKEYKTSSFTVAIQDGEDAGQTIKHVHVHVLPRKKCDFEENDQVYVELSKNDKDLAAKWRTEEEMGHEAKSLRRRARSPSAPTPCRCQK